VLIRFGYVLVERIDLTIGFAVSIHPLGANRFLWDISQRHNLSALFKCQNRWLDSNLIIVALETSNKIGMRSRRAFGVTVGVMAAQTLTIFSETLVDFWMQTN